MRRNLIAIVLVAVGLCCTAAVAQNQQSEQSTQSMGLAERLDALRRSLLNPSPTDAASTKTTRSAARRSPTGSRALHSGNRSTPRQTATSTRTTERATPTSQQRQQLPRPVNVTASETRLAPQANIPAAQSSRRTRTVASKPSNVFPENSPTRPSRHEPSNRSVLAAGPESITSDRVSQDLPRQSTSPRESGTPAKPSILVPPPSTDVVKTAKANAPAESTDVTKQVEPTKTAAAPAQPTEPKTTTPEAAQPATSPTATAPSARQTVAAQAKTAPNSLISKQGAVLNVETIGPRNIVVGKEAVFTIKIDNLSKVQADQVEIAVQLPDSVELINVRESRGTSRNAATASDDAHRLWEVGTLEGGASETLQLTIVPRRNQPIDLAVSWSVAPAMTRTLIDVLEPKLQIAIDGPREIIYGQSKVYTLTITNPGTGDAENVNITLMPLDGGSTPAASHNLGILKAGEGQELEVELTARQAGNLSIKALVSADNGLRAETQEQVLVRRAGLNLVATGPGMKYAGTLANYRIRLTNPGNATAEDVQITAELPRGVEYLDSNDQGQFDAKTGRVQWSLTSIPAGAERVLEVKCSLNESGSSVFQITANASNELTDSAVITTEVEALSDLKLEISDPLGPVPVGEEMVYTLKILNRGSKAASNVDVVTFFSDGIEPVSVHGAGHDLASGQVTFHPIEEIPAGGEILLKIVATATKEGNLVFRAEVQCESAGTRLAAEETTRFYQSRSDQSDPVADQVPAQLPQR